MMRLLASSDGSDELRLLDTQQVIRGAKAKATDGLLRYPGRTFGSEIR